jgi:hypothetical protein
VLLFLSGWIFKKNKYFGASFFLSRVFNFKLQHTVKLLGEKACFGFIFKKAGL